MSKKFFSLAVVAILFSISACNQASCSFNKAGFLNNYQAFLSSVDKKNLSGNSKEWETLDKNLETYIDKCYQQYEDQMTDEEKKDFWTGTVQYYWERHGLGFVRRLGDKNDPLAQEITQNAKELWGGLDKVITELLTELGKTSKNFDATEIEGLLDDMGNDMEKWGKQLENIFGN